MSTVSISSATGAMVLASGVHMTPSAPPSSPISQRRTSAEVASVYRDITRVALRPDAVLSEEELGSSAGTYEVVEPLTKTNNVTHLELKEKRIQMVLLIAIQGASKCPAKIQKMGDRVAIDHNKGFSQSFWRWINGDNREDLRILEKAIPYASIMFPIKANVKLWGFISDGLRQLVAVYGLPNEARNAFDSPKPAEAPIANISENDAKDHSVKEKEKDNSETTMTSIAKTVEIEVKPPSIKTIDALLKELIQTIEKALSKEPSTSHVPAEAKISFTEQIHHPYALANNYISTTVRELRELATTTEEHATNVQRVAAKIEQLKLPSGKFISGLSTELAEIWSPAFITTFVKRLERIEALSASSQGDDIRKLVDGLEVEMNMEAERANDIAQAHMENIWNS